MTERRKKDWPKIIKRGNATVRIYRVVRKKLKRTYTEYKLAYYDDRGARKMESFSDLAIAETRAGEVAAAITRGDAKTLLAMSAEEQLIYQRASNALEKISVPLDVAVSEYISAHSALNGGSIVAAAKHFARTHKDVQERTVEQVVSEFINLRTQRTVKGKPASAAYMRDLNTRLIPLADRFSIPIHGLTPALIEEYIKDGKFEGRSRHNTLRVIRTLLRFAKARRYFPSDVEPMEGIEMRFEDEGEIGIFTPAEMRRLIKAASDQHPNLLAFLLIGGFAGLRSAEIARLAWSDLQDDYVQVGAKKAKTRSRRLVPIQPNLAAWLKTIKKESATVVSLDAINHGFSALTAATKTDKLPAVEWKNNGLRHSFITYRYELTKDEGKVASEAGNSPAMVHRHYRALTKEATAKEWFEVRPLSS